MDLIEDIGPILGIVAFLGFAILALLIVLQAREVRRLREWAGRAPERAVEADDAALAAAEARGITGGNEGPGFFGRQRERIGRRVGPAWDAVDRNSPIDPKIILGVLVVALIAVGVVTSGFGLVGGDDPAPVAGKKNKEKPEKIEVAVLNATQQEGIADPVAGIADFVANEVVKPGGFKAGVRTDSLAGEEDSIIMFEPENEADAEALAEAVTEELGETPIEEMSAAVRDQVDGAPLAILVGLRDSTIVETGTDETAETAVP